MDLVKNPDHIASFLIQIRHLLLDFLQQVSIGDQGGSQLMHTSRSSTSCSKSSLRRSTSQESI